MTNKLNDLLNNRPLMTLDEFVEQSNQLLPNYLPQEAANNRIKAEVNVRLIRHYSSEGLLDDALKEGREARYESKHLLQLLVLRRLLAEGFGTSTVKDILQGKGEQELLGLLEGGLKVEVTPQLTSNNALSYLDSIRQRNPQPQPAQRQSRNRVNPINPAPTPTAQSKQSTWERHELLEGLELHVREDFKVPSSLQAQENLLQYLMQKLIAIHQRRKS